jgi:PAS domain S-box-containing protein
MKELCQESGKPRFMVTAVSRLDTALESLNQSPADVVLLDCTVPNIDGVETVSRVRELIPHLPLVVLTSHEDEPVALQALRHGAQDYLVKDKLDFSLFRRTIRYAIERHQAEENLRESELRFRGTFENASVGIAHVNLQGTILLVNQILCKLLGFGKEELCGKTFREFTHPEDRDLDSEQCKNIGEGDGDDYTVDKRYLRKDGTILWMAVKTAVQRDPNGRPVFCIVVMEDVTERKKSEMQLLEFNERLEQRVKERTQSLLEYQEQLRTLASKLTLVEHRERRRLATELHDYLAQLLVVCRMKLGQAAQMSALPALQNLLKETDEILDESLTYTRSLVAELSPSVLYQFGLLRALEWLGDKMQHHGLTVGVKNEAGQIHLSSDHAILVYQTVRELLFNIVKHAGVSEASLSLGQDEGFLLVEVSDAGVGFDPPDLDETGSPFTTYGLMSIRERVEALKGHFVLDSAQGKGTRVQLWIPLTSEASLSEPASVPASLTKQTKAKSTREPKPTVKPEEIHLIRVLIVEDHSMVREGLRSILNGFRDVQVVGEASDGEEAVAVSRTLQPDVIVMDVNMPKMDGIEATKHILHARPRTVIIGLSVNDDPFIAETLIKAGASGYLTKGRAAKDLYHTIWSAYKSKHGN